MTYMPNIMSQRGIESINIECLDNGFVVGFRMTDSTDPYKREYFKDFAGAIKYLCDALEVKYKIDLEETK